MKQVRNSFQGILEEIPGSSNSLCMQGCFGNAWGQVYKKASAFGQNSTSIAA